MDISCTFNKKPDISFEFKEVDFGLVYAGDSVNVNFPFVNNGSASLQILEINSSCYCTVVKFRKDEIDPGQSDTINVCLRSYKDESLGLQNSSIVVRTNTDPQLTILHVKGVVKNDSLADQISLGKATKLH